MTIQTPPVPAPWPQVRPGLRDAVRSEWIKLVSLRSTYIVPVAGAILPILAMLLGAVWTEDPESVPLAGSATALFQIPIVAVATTVAAAVTSEYGHNTIRVTYSATPNRSMVIGARVLAAVTYVLLVLTITMIVLIGVGAVAVILRGSSPPIEWGDLETLALVVLAGVLFSVAAMSFGLFVRNTAAAATITAVYPFAELVTMYTVLAQYRPGLMKWVPFQTMWNSAQGNSAESVLYEVMGRWQGVGYYTAVVAALLIIAWLRELRRDA